MASTSTSSIVSRLRTPASTGAQINVNQVKRALDKQLKEAGAALKLVILGMIQAQHRNNITSSSSDIAKQTTVALDTDGLKIGLPDFADDIDRGRKRGTYPPFRQILAWVLKYNIRGKSSANSLAFAIQRAIFNKGVKPKPFIKDMEQYAEDLMNKISDEVILPNLIQPLYSILDKQ